MACIGDRLFCELTLSEHKKCCFESMHLFVCVCIRRRRMDELVEDKAET